MRCMNSKKTKADESHVRKIVPCYIYDQRIFRVEAGVISDDG